MLPLLLVGCVSVQLVVCVKEGVWWMRRRAVTLLVGATQEACYLLLVEWGCWLWAGPAWRSGC